MRFLRGRIPHVAARRAWHEDGTPVWEFRFTSRRTSTTVDAGASRPVEARPPVRFVSSRGVELGGDTLWIDQFHHRIRKPVTPENTRPDSTTPDSTRQEGTRQEGTRQDSTTSDDTKQEGIGQENARQEGIKQESARQANLRQEEHRIDVATALVELAAAPDVEAAQHRVVASLAQDRTCPSTPVLDISAARITGGGLGHRLDGVFIWRAEGRPDLTYLVAPDPSTRDLLAADLDLVRALIRAACPQPDDPLGELESSLRETLTRLGVTGGPAVEQRPSVTSAVDLVLKVNPRPDHLGQTDRSEQPKTESERALSDELAELARKVGTASVRAPGRSSKAG